METLAPSTPDAPPVPLDNWTADIGINPNTVRQRQKRGWLKIARNASRHFLIAARLPETGGFAQTPCGKLFRQRARIEIRSRN